MVVGGHHAKAMFGVAVRSWRPGVADNPLGSCHVMCRCTCVLHLKPRRPSLNARSATVSPMKEPVLLHEPESMQKYSDEMREQIAKKAYELYENRGRQAERDVEDWLQAEKLVRQEMIGECEV